jgi:DUF1680 family protein
VDALAGLHANTHIPQAVGMARGYEVTGNQTQRRMAEFFFDTVYRTRAYLLRGIYILETAETSAIGVS